MTVSAFIKTEITSTSAMENAGNFCLSPLRTLFGGRSFSIVNDKVVEWHPKAKSTLDRVIMIAVSILILIPATMIGIVIKAIAFASKEVREKQDRIITHMATTPQKNDGYARISRESDSEEESFSSEANDAAEFELGEGVDYTRRGELFTASEAHFGRIKVILKRGDITKEPCDVVVNAANTSLVKGGGVDDAIHRAAGPLIQQECLNHPVEMGVRCPEGAVRATSAGNLPAKRIFHTVGPRWRGGSAGEEATLKNCYANCIKLAAAENYKSISFPSISTGIFGYPLDKASKAAFRAISDTANEFGPGAPLEVRFILFHKADMDAYTSALKNIADNG